MTITVCSNCKKEFNQKYYNKEAKNHFCCKQCESEFRKGKLNRPKKINDIVLQENYAIIKIKNNLYGDFDCLIDIEDIEKIKNFYWNIRYDKRHPNCLPYVESHPMGKRLHLHRFIMNCPNDMVIDHINGNNLDNRKNNLRICTQSINCLNNHNAKNIHFDKRSGIYIVHFTINGKTKVICRTRNYDEAMEYANLGKELINQGNTKEVLEMPCKHIELPKNNTSGFLGVQKYGKRFQAWLNCKYLGTYDTAEEAYKARLQAQERHFLKKD